MRVMANNRPDKKSTYEKPVLLLAQPLAILIIFDWIILTNIKSLPTARVIESIILNVLVFNLMKCFKNYTKIKLYNMKRRSNY